MDEKIREAILDGVAEQYGAWTAGQKPNREFAEAALERVEAKLSPKYPPDGAICEVWSNVDSDRWPAISDGEKLVDLFPGSVTGYIDSWDFSEVHYRRIVTAEEALDAIDEAFKHGGTLGVMEAYDYLRGIVKSLIDNAERG